MNFESTSSEKFNELVANALDFLGRSLGEVEISPKYSIIHFQAAVELFLKARLMLEHWTLIIDDPGKANIDKFRNGDFKSVGMEEAINRLANTSQEKIGDNPKKAFKSLSDHRNKFIHFYHPDYSLSPSQNAITQIVKEQYISWYYLYPLLTKKWRDQFQDYQDKIEELNQELKNNRAYLQVRYEKLLPAIEKGKQNGTTFYVCAVCEYEAKTAKETEMAPFLVDSNCLVCENDSTNDILMSCPHCKADILIADFHEGYCPKCESKVSPYEIIDQVKPKPRNKDELADWIDIPTSCLYCHDWSESVILIPSIHEWICLSCFEIFDWSDIWNCSRCGRAFAGPYDPKSTWHELDMCADCAESLFKRD